MNRFRTIRTLAALSVLFTVASALADGKTFIWINTANQRRGLVESTADWQDGLRPTTDYKLSASQTNDTFVFSSNTAWKQTIYGPSAGYLWPYYAGTITGTFSHYLTCVTTYNFRFLVLKDAETFEGTLGGDTHNSQASGSGGFLLLATPDRPSHIKNFRAMGAPTLGVLANNATGVLDHVSGNGFFRAPNAQGSSDFARKNTVVEIGAIEGGVKLAANVSESGTLLVHGSKAGVPAVVGNPAFHLDANAPGSMTFEDGRLVRWADVDGRPFAAVKDGDKLAPTVAGDDHVDLDMVDFGAMGNRSDQVPHCGKSSTLVFEGGVVENIREAFIVFRDQSVYERPIPGEGGMVDGRYDCWMISQNFLGCAKGQPQYFARVTQRRSGAGWYFSQLIDVGVVSAGGNYMRDYGATATQMNGADIRLDGAYVQASAGNEFDHEPHVLSVGLRADAVGAKADRLACNGSGTLGGIRLGEVIVYTNALTLAQRRAVNAYLMAKWHPEKPNDLDFKWVKEDSGAHLKAADGTLRVGQYDAGSSAIAMEGNLDVTTLKGDRRSLAFSNGASNLTLRTDTFAESLVVPTEPSGTPDVWLDANRGVTTFVTNVNNFGTTTYVSKWVDARNGTNSYGYAITASRTGVSSPLPATRLALDSLTGQVVPSTYPCWPTIAEFGGLKMVDMGPQHQNDISHSRSGAVPFEDPVTHKVYTGITELYYYKWQKARDGSAMSFSRVKGTSKPVDYYSFATAFWVLRVNEDTATDQDGKTVVPYAITLPSRAVAFAESLLLGRHYSIISEFSDAEWYVNGERVDSNSFKFEKGRTYVVGIRLASVSSYPSLSSLAYYPSGAGSGSWGGLCFGEYIEYNYAMPDRDYFETEAYLMKRWLNQEHPAIANAKKKVTLSALSYADAAKPSVDNDRDLDAGVLDTGASDSFEKRGAGELRVLSKTDAVRNYSAEGGTLDATVDWLADAALHMDASREDTIAYVKGQEAEGRIDRWYDCRGNGYYAQSLLSYPSGGGTKPITNAVYVKTGTASGGLKAGSKYVDFGTSSSEAKRGGMGWRDPFGKEITLTNTREYHVVFSITASGNYLPVGGPLGPQANAIVPSGNLQTAFYGHCTRAQNAVKTQDGSDWFTANRYKAEEGALDTTKFYVTSMQFAGDVQTFSFAADRSNCGFGNVKLCEAILFTGNTNSAARCRAIHEYLRKKWKGESAEGMGDPPPVALDAINVEKGAAISFDPCGAALSTKSLTGLGTIDVPGRLTVDAERFDIAAKFTAPDVCEKLTVNGALTLPARGKVTLTAAEGVRPATGTYPVVSTLGLTVDLDGWTLDSSALPNSRVYTLKRQGNDIVVSVGMWGIVVIFR